MKIFSALKTFLDTGGLGYSIECGDSFRWEEGSLPFVLIVRGHESIDRTIDVISIELEEEKTGTDREQRRRRSGVRHTDRIDGPFQIPAGEAVRVDMRFDFPESSGVANALGTALDLLSTGSVTFGKRRFVIRATPSVKGMKIAKSTSAHIYLES